MQHRIWRRLGAALLIASIGLPAQAAPVALGFRSGTLGLYGVEATLGLSDRLDLRVPLSLLDFSYDDRQDGVDYDGKLRLRSLGGQIDLHPFKSSFYLTAGIFANGNRLHLRASDPSGQEEYRIGDSDRVYTSDPSDPLKLSGRARFRSAAPLLGLGWGNAMQGDSNVYFRFELGALLQGSPTVSLKASGSAIDQQSGLSFSTTGNGLPAQIFQAQLDEERQSLEHDIGDIIKVYPSLTLAFGLRFGH